MTPITAALEAELAKVRAELDGKLWHWQNRAIKAETERDGWLRIVGLIAEQVPLPDVIKATGTAADLIAYFKAQQAELARLREALEKASAYIKRGYVNAEGGAILEQIDAARALSGGGK